MNKSQLALSIVFSLLLSSVPLGSAWASPEKYHVQMKESKGKVGSFILGSQELKKNLRDGKIVLINPKKADFKKIQKDLDIKIKFAPPKSKVSSEGNLDTFGSIRYFRT